VQGTSHGWWPKGSRRNKTANWASVPRPCSHVFQHVPGDTRTSSRARSVDPAPSGESSPSGVGGRSVVSTGARPQEAYSSTSIAVGRGASSVSIIVSSWSEGGTHHKASALRLPPLRGEPVALTEKCFSM
jgi:hypothetical protein